MKQLRFENIKDLKYRQSKYIKKAIELDKAFNNYEIINTKKADEKKIGWGFIDLFAGAGGMSLGFKEAGFNLLLDVEKEEYAAKTLEYNFLEAKHFHGDIKNFNPKKHIKEEEVDIVIGGPPCQGFSIAGERNEKDERNLLFEEFIRVVSELNPSFVVMENVPGIITLDEGNFFDNIIKSFERLNYEVTARILESADFGVPQLRSRAIFVGNKKGIKNPYPKKIYSAEEYKTIDDAIEDLEKKDRDSSINHEWTNHSKKTIDRISKVEPGESLYDSYKDAYKRQRIGEPSMTIKENHGGTHIHYKLNRCISVREMARIQTFPDDFYFKGSHKKGFIQVGNAVPPLLAKHLGLAIKKSIVKNGLLNNN